MMRKWLIVAGVGLLLAQPGLVRAEEDIRDITRRIQALRERLDHYRDPSLPGQSTTPEPSGQQPAAAPATPPAMTPADKPADAVTESEALEKRRDVTVTILFHDGPAAPANPAAVSPVVPAPGAEVKPVSAPAGVQLPAAGSQMNQPTPTAADPAGNGPAKTLKKSWLEDARRRVAMRLQS
ncbi:MAG: hypothetical protein GX442_26635 [Candidatus Riflebacteria bacterium]|nr:hypothetical protein [Candidatus Riflebacteria bacterium]